MILLQSVAELRAEDIELEDIATSLAGIVRFRGLGWSDARHSLLMAMHAPGPLVLPCAFHDAAETYMGDVASPFKTAGFRRTEDKVMRVICERFGLGWPFPPEVKVLDVRALRTEVDDIFGIADARRVAPNVRPLSTEGLPRGACRAAWLAIVRKHGAR